MYCKCEDGNAHDAFAVAVCKESTIVGHIPRTLSATCFSFLSMEGSSICCRVTGPREYSRDLPQGGLQVPCTLEFRGNKVNVENVKITVRKQREYRKKMGLSSDAEDARGNTTDTPQATPTVNNGTDISTSVQNTELVTCSSTTKVEVDATLEGGVEEPHNYQNVAVHVLPSSSKYIAMEHNYCKNELSKVWVRHGRSFLTTAERDMINYGKQLNDKHINYAQMVIRSQFSIKGMQLTLYQHTKKPSENEFQIIHCRGNHWITASTIFSSGSVDVYDSLYDDLDCGSRRVILDCLVMTSFKSICSKCKSSMAQMIVACLPLLLQFHWQGK